MDILLLCIIGISCLFLFAVLGHALSKSNSEGCLLMMLVGILLVVAFFVFARSA